MLNIVKISVKKECKGSENISIAKTDTHQKYAIKHQINLYNILIMRR